MSSRTGLLNLAFVDPDAGAICKELAARQRQRGARALLYPGNRLAETVTQASRRAGMSAVACASLDDVLDRASPKGSEDAPQDACIVLLHENAADLSDALVRLVDLPRGSVIAPVTSHYWKHRPLFLISIPKSGTHLVYELVAAFGYVLGGNSPDNPTGGVAYFINSMNPHTATTFLDFTDSSFNLYHPFMRCPALFSYRNPLDIVVSEANYYHKDGRSAFWSYLSGMDFDGRVRLLVNDPFLLGSIRDRVRPFIGWLDVKNVIPVSYEELVGERGSGDGRIQDRLIWSLQLKLHVPGDPADYANRIYSDKSPTFNSGQLGSHRRALPDAALQEFHSLPQDFMRRLGYLDENVLLYSKRKDEFRRRPLVLSEAVVDDRPILMLANYCNHNIVRFRGRYYALHAALGPLRLDTLSDIELDRLVSDVDLNSLRQQVLAAPKMSFPRRVFHKLRRVLRGTG